MKLLRAALVGLVLVASPQNVNADEFTSVVESVLGPADEQCGTFGCDEEQSVSIARAYLAKTSRPGGTMMRQGPELSIRRLHPEFAKRLANAINAARRAGLDEAGIFSAYRPPVFGVGGFADKYYSLHAYGLAVDMYGVGRPGSAEAKKWHEIAAQHGIVCPYGYNDRAEWNHCQPTHLIAVRAENPLRQTIERKGPIDLSRMFEIGTRFIDDATVAVATAAANRSVTAIEVITARITSRPRLVRQNAMPNRLARRVSASVRVARSASGAQRQSRSKVASLGRQSR